MGTSPASAVRDMGRIPPAAARIREHRFFTSMALAAARWLTR
jgi:hypothetical protein